MAKQPQFKDKQAGISGFGILFVLAVLGFAGFIASKTVPPYLEQRKVLFIQEAVASQLGAADKSRTQLQTELIRRLTLEDVDAVGRKQLFITKDGGNWQLRIAYARQINLFESIDLLMKYDETVEVPR